MDGAYSHEGSEADSHHGVGSAWGTDHWMLLKVGGVALLLVAGFAFALYYRLRRSRLPKKHVHSRVASGAFEDEEDEDEDEEEEELEVLDGIQIDQEMVHTGYGCVQPGSITVGRTDEVRMLTH